MGSMVDGLLVHGLRVLERLYPMPSRLGAPLPPERRPRVDADPVVLIGGFANSVEGWSEWKRSLELDGFQVFAFDPPTFGLGDMEASARAVAAFIAEVRRKTGRRRVDVVGFSEGGVLARMVVARLGGLGWIDRLVSLASPHGGVPYGGLHDALRALPLLGGGVPQALTQLLEGSALLRGVELDDRALRLGDASGRRDPRAPRYASIFSRTFDFITSPMSAWLPGALNLPVASDGTHGLGPNHFQMYHTSDRAYAVARTLLLDEPDATAVAEAGVVGRVN
ncbi:MAG: estB 4 [Thermoleophilia bacterium]|nr:estB 4 [Thermoleophilia bacterium]